MENRRTAALRIRRSPALAFALLEDGKVAAYFGRRAVAATGFQDYPAEELKDELSEDPEELAIDIFENPEAAHSEDWAHVPPDFQEGMVRFYCHTSPHLIVSLGGREILRYKLPMGRTIIGRDPTNDLTIDNLSVSRRHAVIEMADCVCTIEDAGSSNGTFVGGRRIKEAAPLADGDEATIGKHALRYVARALISSIGSPASEGIDKTVYMRAPQFSDKDATSSMPMLTMGGQSSVVRRSPFIIGSDPGCDLALKGPGIRANHAVLTRDAGGQVSISHCGGLLSATRVNGRKVRTAPLQNGDQIQIGSMLLRFLVRQRFGQT
jgi:pSer/pThr/pTyr-binding forkhead associated (FHA) protein